MRRPLVVALWTVGLVAPAPALAWVHCPIFEDTTVSWYRTAALTSHNGKLFFVGEFFIEGPSVDAVELRYRAFDGDTSVSGCPSGLGPVYTVLDDGELGPASTDYSLLTSLSPTNNASTLAISHKTGDVSAADLRATTFQKSDGVVTEQVLIDLVNLADPVAEDHNHKHSFFIRNPVHDEDHACFTFEDATNGEDAMCAVRDLGDPAWSTTLVNLPTSGASNNQHATFRLDPTSGARGILYNVIDAVEEGLLWRAENANEVELGAGPVEPDENFDWPAMDFRASRWYGVVQETVAGGNHNIHFTECPPDPAQAIYSIDATDTGTVEYNDCLSPQAWRMLQELGNPSFNLRHPVVAADPCGNVFVAWMNLHGDTETIEWDYRCVSGPGAYSWAGVTTVSDDTYDAMWYSGRSGDPMAWTPITYDSTDDMIHVVYAQDTDDGDGLAEDWEIVWSRIDNPCTCEE